MKVYENNRWVIKNKKAMICKMYNKHEKIIREVFERIKDQLSKQVRENYKEYSSSVHSSFHTYNQRLLDTEAVVLTGSMQQKNIESLRSEEVLRLAEEQGKTPSEIFAEHIIAQEHDNILEADRLNELGITDI
jgi:sugar-specific transcriptional regulator TrmB